VKLGELDAIARKTVGPDRSERDAVIDVDAGTQNRSDPGI
jgi:hypothetical protein